MVESQRGMLADHLGRTSLVPVRIRATVGVGDGADIAEERDEIIDHLVPIALILSRRSERVEAHERILTS